MKPVFAILGYTTENIGDDIQSYVTSKIFSPKYIINRDNPDEVYDFETCTRTEIQEDEVQLIMNGWMTHNYKGFGPFSHNFENDYRFPYKNKKIKPIFISTHLSPYVPHLFNEESMNYYKSNLPFFTRDKSTEKVLKENGVDCEFLGCISQLLKREWVPDTEEDKFKGAIFLVNADNVSNLEDGPKFRVNHYSEELRAKTMLERRNIVTSLLAKYKHAKTIYTTKLHCFLPCRAMGIDVRYSGPLDERTAELVTTEPNTTRLEEEISKILSQR